MYEMLDAHALTIIIIVGSIMVTPFYILAVYVFSHASPKNGLIIGSAFLLFYPAVTNNLILFPTGMIPLFLVPYAIFFHTLSLVNYAKFER
jgi:hypothetical protein